MHCAPLVNHQMYSGDYVCTYCDSPTTHFSFLFIQCEYPLDSPAPHGSRGECHTPSTPTRHNIMQHQTPPDSPWWVTKLVTSVSGYFIASDDDWNKENRNSNVQISLSENIYIFRYYSAFLSSVSLHTFISFFSFLSPIRIPLNTSGIKLLVDVNCKHGRHGSMQAQLIVPLDVVDGGGEP